MANQVWPPKSTSFTYTRKKKKREQCHNQNSPKPSVIYIKGWWDTPLNIKKVKQLLYIWNKKLLLFRKSGHEGLLQGNLNMLDAPKAKLSLSRTQMRPRKRLLPYKTGLSVYSKVQISHVCWFGSYHRKSLMSEWLCHCLLCGWGGVAGMN